MSLGLRGASGSGCWARNPSTPGGVRAGTPRPRVASSRRPQATKLAAIRNADRRWPAFLGPPTDERQAVLCRSSSISAVHHAFCDNASSLPSPNESRLGHKPANGSKIKCVPHSMRVNRCCDPASSWTPAQNRWPSFCLFVIFAALSVLASLAETSPQRTYGDPAIRTAVDIQLKRIYELTSGSVQQLELLTKDNPLELRGAFATEVTASLVDASMARIVGAVFTNKGKYSFEFYRAGGKLLMVYETFAYFPDAAPHDAWHNFMGLAAWESRIYFDSKNEMGFAETQGPQAPVPDVSVRKAHERVEHLVNLLDHSSSRWVRR